MFIYIVYCCAIKNKYFIPKWSIKYKKDYNFPYLRSMSFL